MKPNSLKRALVWMLSVLLVAGCFAGCGDSGSYSSGDNNMAVPTQPYYEPFTMPPTLPPLTDAPETEAPTEPEAPGQLVAADGEQISYVMIYNPQIYTSDFSPQALKTGTISNQIDVDLNRGSELTGEVEIEPYEQKPLDPEFLDKINLEGGKADGLGKTYRVGDQEAFYCGSQTNIDIRSNQLFTCVYTGTHANIWVYYEMDQALMEQMGSLFDASIYDNCVSRFGDARFGEIVNILIYPFEGNPNTVGFFHPFDLYSTMECDDLTAQTYGINRNINVINMNALWLQDEPTFISTLAHEFQHLLCFTGFFTAGNECDLWFNEAMSGYIEEALYPGSKASSVESYHLSERIRYGQSLYNFGTDVTAYKLDIGVYGSVYLFSEYMKNVGGDNIFSEFHANWRNTYVPMDTFEGIYQIMPADVRQQVDAMIQYPSSVGFDSEAQEWMSKFTLSFYLSTFTKDENTPELYRDVVLPYLLYDSMVDANIEGGGRVVLATKDGTFQIPEDADSGLVYVGLNENMEVVTDLVCS